MYQNILSEQQGQIATITINRPQQLNALNKATILELHACLSELNNSKSTNNNKSDQKPKKLFFIKKEDEDDDDEKKWIASL
jgi:hypothetical protein